MPLRIMHPLMEKDTNTLYVYDSDEYVYVNGAAVSNAIYNLSASNRDIKSKLIFGSTTLYEDTVTVEAFKWKITTAQSSALKSNDWLYGIISLPDGTHPSSTGIYIEWKSYSQWKRYFANKGTLDTSSSGGQPEYIVYTYGNYEDFTKEKVSGDNPYGKYWLKLTKSLGKYGRFALRFWNKPSVGKNQVEDDPALPWDSMTIFFKTKNAQPIICWRGMPMRVLSADTKYLISGYFTDILLYNNSGISVTAELYIGAIMLYPNKSY